MTNTTPQDPYYVWPASYGFSVREKIGETGVREVCICHTADDAAKIVFALNHTRGM